MDALLFTYGLDWLNLLGRWLHLITGIAWIGASFYFVWLDNSIRPPKPGSELERQGVSGELWAVHGGGFYNPQKYLLAPKNLPPDLHWFKWEAYATWLSGFFLLLVVYYANPQGMMIDPAVATLASWQAIGIGLATLVTGWTVYDLLCRTRLGQHDLWFGVVIYGLIVAVAYVLTHLLSGRAAYLHVGAMIGTIMAGNVLMVIIPGQRKMVSAMSAGQTPDPIYGKRGKQRSVHNNYFSLPILFIMISNHYGMTYNHAHAWLVLAAIIAAAVSIRHFFNLRHRERTEWRYPVIGVLILLAVAIAIAPRPVVRDPAIASDIGRVQAIVSQRCVSCHAAQPQQAGFAAAPAGIMLESEAQLRQHAAKVYQQAVVLKAMPLANMTNITEGERAIIGAWFEAGAK